MTAAARATADPLALLRFAGYFLLSIPVHETFHFIALRALGGDGYVVFTLRGGWTAFSDLPRHDWLVLLAGGVLTALVFTSFFWWLVGRRRDWSPLAVAAVHLAYAPTELVG